MLATLCGRVIADGSAQDTTDDGRKLVQSIGENASRYVTLFCEEVDKILKQNPGTTDINDQSEVIDVIMHQRRERNEATDQAGFPDHILRR